MSDKPRSNRTPAESDGRELAARDADIAEVTEQEQAGGLLGLVGRASNSAFSFGREVGGSAQRLTRHLVTEAEHLVDVARTVEQVPHVVVHGEVVDEEDIDDEPTGPTRDELRRAGDRLLARSAAVASAEGPHPAYAHILEQLAPDEARILRLLRREGAQPSVDVRTNRPFGVGSETVAAGLSMIAEVAGCRRQDRIAEYLGNLHRLGLIWFSKEQVEVQRYELLQVQPMVVEALGNAGRYAKTIRRRIEITPLGTAFCDTCFTFD
ncbi:hypothetical protein TPAU25S_02281 [Tsukamurella paurometabola]|uniref:DUF4393 domain-containing protein n=1 Tax=Tsukamurella paurometabola (strain ATCC 8368 / DSM 20162 / CCUG 35730 / CIP 100753 / JCM 10117 / KCTC 9821 / NBRC 16120 / NCIMB 702349 / NCTC 13040) TaxID=521096 RepID=D5UTT1_TSUPD|nr:Abi-alpha family protein [Tsukamurella paurometabola]ADG77435.1 conserved hypothetical protein [Tsukamurella paurometabola DSM 20162]SUP27034.1 Uncharacterised protein [Tsukamurella paurometabola]